MIHRCSNCWVAQYQIKSDVLCRNEWWPEWDALQLEARYE
jgi:hypothetical protein